jgi:hypothetical protein
MSQKGLWTLILFRPIQISGNGIYIGFEGFDAFLGDLAGSQGIIVAKTLDDFNIAGFL